MIVFVLSSAQVHWDASSWDQWLDRTAVPGWKPAPGLQGKDTGTCFIPKEEKQLNQRCQAASLSSWPYVSPPIMGSQVRNINYSWTDESKGEAACCHVYCFVVTMWSLSQLCPVHICPQFSCGVSLIHSVLLRATLSLSVEQGCSSRFED